MLKIEIDSSKLRIKIKQIRNLEIGKLSNYKADLLKLVQTQVTKNFEQQQSGEGQKWKRLAPATLKQKEQQGFPATPLVRTGALRKAINSLVATPTGQGKSLQIGIANSKIKRLAEYQQFGTKTIPSRPFLTLNVRLSELVSRTIVEKEIAKIKQTLT